LIWELFARRLDATQLVGATGTSIWYLEWSIAIVGLAGGIWPKWTIPFLRLLGIVPKAILELLARFFEWMGHAFLWAPSQLIHAIVRPFQALGQLTPPHIDLPHMRLPQRAPRARSQPRENSPRVKRQRFARPKAAAHNHANNGNGPRVVSVVEDRCPYCLDIVKRNDPRGVKVCEVCGTPHHADCWSITGKCQVPHLNM
jgi:hypothetical protein